MSMGQQCVMKPGSQLFQLPVSVQSIAVQTDVTSGRSLMLSRHPCPGRHAYFNSDRLTAGCAPSALEPQWGAQQWVVDLTCSKQWTRAVGFRRCGFAEQKH